MAVHFKFKSAKEFDTVLIEGQSISVAKLKAKVIQKLKIDRASGFDLVFSNAHTDEEYVNEGFLVEENTSIIVRRVPAKLCLPPQNADDRTTNYGMERPDQFTVNSASDAFAPQVNMIEAATTQVNTVQPEIQAYTPDYPQACIDSDEDFKIKEFVDSTALDWMRQTQEASRKDQGRGRGNGFINKIPHHGYVCHRCGVAGHFIQNCPRLKDHTYNFRNVKGIPRTMLSADPNGSYALPNGDTAALKPNEAAFEKEFEATVPANRSLDIPPELRCPLCHDALENAVLTSKCCFKSYCDRCIRKELETKSACVCGANNVVADDLLPNKTLREAIDRLLSAHGATSSDGKSQVQGGKESGEAIDGTPDSATTKEEGKQVCIQGNSHKEKSEIFHSARRSKPRRTQVIKRNHPVQWKQPYVNRNAPYVVGSAVHYSGFWSGGMNDMLPQYPVNPPTCYAPLPYATTPSALPGFQMYGGPNPPPVLMSREQFEAKKAEIKRRKNDVDHHRRNQKGGRVRSSQAMKIRSISRSRSISKSPSVTRSLSAGCSGRGGDSSRSNSPAAPRFRRNNHKSPPSGWKGRSKSPQSPIRRSRSPGFYRRNSACRQRSETPVPVQKSLGKKKKSSLRSWSPEFHHQRRASPVRNRDGGRCGNGDGELRSRSPCDRRRPMHGKMSIQSVKRSTPGQQQTRNQLRPRPRSIDPVCCEADCSRGPGRGGYSVSPARERFLQKCSRQQPVSRPRMKPGPRYQGGGKSRRQVDDFSDDDDEELLEDVDGCNGGIRSARPSGNGNGMVVVRGGAARDMSFSPPPRRRLVTDYSDDFSGDCSRSVCEMEEDEEMMASPLPLPSPSPTPSPPPSLPSSHRQVVYLGRRSGGGVMNGGGGRRVVECCAPSLPPQQQLKVTKKRNVLQRLVVVKNQHQQQQQQQQQNVMGMQNGRKRTAVFLDTQQQQQQQQNVLVSRAKRMKMTNEYNNGNNSNNNSKSVFDRISFAGSKAATSGMGVRRMGNENAHNSNRVVVLYT